VGRGPQTFRERDVTRFLKAILKAGLDVERIENEGGKMTAFTAGKTIAEHTLSADDELARWRGKRNANRT
jgi:hypothetical protein